jgi:hypothetical protein
MIAFQSIWYNCPIKVWSIEAFLKVTKMSNMQALIGV